jgi:outer membrane lipoprotein-sorting protein
MKHIEGLLDKASIQTDHTINQAVRDELLATYSQAMNLPPHPERPSLGRRLVASKITRLAVAAAIAVAAFIGFSHVASPAVAWGEVVGRVEQATAFMFSLKTIVAGDSEQGTPPKAQAQWTIYLSQEHGFRMDITGQGPNAQPGTVSWYVPPQQDKITMVIPGEKKWVQMPYSAEYTKQEKDKDPADYIRRFMAKGYKEIGRKTVEGIEVEGIEVQDPPTEGGSLEKGVGRMWVDVKTQMPVRIEIEGLAGQQPVQWIMDFRWSEAIDPAVFEPNIPADYTSIQ